MNDLISKPKVTKPNLWGKIILSIFFIGMALVSEVNAQDDDSPQLIVIASALNVRVGPNVTYEAFTVLTQGDEVPLISYDNVNNWWEVQLPNEHTGWVSGNPAYVAIKGNVTNLPKKMVSDQSSGQAPSSFVNNFVTTGIVVIQTASGGPIYTINPDGTNLCLLTTGIDPSLSTDGQWVAFTRWDDIQHGAFGSLWVINVDGSGERVVAGGIRQPKSPVWSPDNTKIVLGMQHGGRLKKEHVCGNTFPPAEAEDIKVFIDGDGKPKVCYKLEPHPFWGLRVVDVKTGNFEDSPRDTHSYSPTWDPKNNSRIVYDGDMGLVNLDLNSKTTQALTQDVRDHSPAFSPDGSKIAVSYKQHDHWDIHVLDAQGSNRTRLTETSLLVIANQILNEEATKSWNNTAPSWSPDGTKIIFLTDRAGRWEVWIMNTDGSNQRPMFSDITNNQLKITYSSVDERVLSWR